VITARGGGIQAECPGQAAPPSIRDLDEAETCKVDRFGTKTRVQHIGKVHVRACTHRLTLCSWSPIDARTGPTRRAQASLPPTPSRWLAGPRQARFGLRSADHLQQDLAEARILPLPLQILKQPGRSFNRQHTRLAEPGFGEFALQLIRSVQVRGGEKRVFGTAVRTVSQILPCDPRVTRVGREVADQSVQRGGES
jgi:hypothetical protein